MKNQKKTNLILVIAIPFVFFCTIQTGISQVPVRAEKERRPPPPPPPTPPVDSVFQVLDEAYNLLGCEDELTDSKKIRCAEEKILTHVYANLKYPKIARDKGVEGIVIVSFYMDKDGTLKEPVLIKNIGAGCGLEAIRVIKQVSNIISKKSLPRSRDKPVKIFFKLPINFELDKIENEN